MAATQTPNSSASCGKESIMDFSTIQHGLLPAGTVTLQGVIERSSLTAYLVDGTWVPFSTVHGPYRAASPLVTFGGW